MAVAHLDYTLPSEDVSPPSSAFQPVVAGGNAAWQMRPDLGIASLEEIGFVRQLGGPSDSGLLSQVATLFGFVAHPESVADASGEALRREFRRLASRWYEESRFMSSLTDMALLDSYQRIIGMGEKAIPLILLELGSQPDQWFWALEKITGEITPVSEEFRGNLPAMAEAWLRWGRDRGYVR